jgi:hypothetical protein
MVAISDDNNIRIFNPNLSLRNEWYPWIVKEIAKLNLPPRTLIDAEFVVEHEEKDLPEYMQTLDKSPPDQAKNSQLMSQWKRPKAIILGMPYYDGVPIQTTLPVSKWMDYTNEIAKKIVSYNYIQTIEILPLVSYGNNIHLASNKNLTGLVLYDKHSCFGNKAISTNGNAKNPYGCWVGYL